MTYVLSGHLPLPFYASFVTYSTFPMCLDFHICKKGRKYLYQLSAFSCTGNDVWGTAPHRGTGAMGEANLFMNMKIQLLLAHGQMKFDGIINYNNNSADIH